MTEGRPHHTFASDVESDSRANIVIISGGRNSINIAWAIIMANAGVPSIIRGEKITLEESKK